MSFCQHEYAVLQIAKIQKFFELTKNIFPSTLALLFNALYINTLFRNPSNPFRIPFPFLRWPFSCRRWPSSFPLPIPPVFAHRPFHFSLFRPLLSPFSPAQNTSLQSLPSAHISRPFPVPRFRQSFPFTARFRFLVSVNLFHSLPVSGSLFPSIIFIHCPFSVFTPFLLNRHFIRLSSHSSISLISHSSIVCFFFRHAQLFIPAFALLSVASNYLENCL